MNTRFALLSHPGIRRQGKPNEDGILGLRLPGRDETVIAVADGLGGLAHGAVASAHVLRRMRAALQDCSGESPLTCIVPALEQANRDLVDFAGGDPAKALGTTIVGLVIEPERFIPFHMGDSRAYALRAGSNLEQVTADHSVVAERVRRGLMTAAEAAESPERNQITRCLGVDPEFELEVGDPGALEPGMRLLVCSDGLHGPVSADQIATLLAYGDDPLAIARQLVLAAIRNGGPDNISVGVAVVAG